MNAFDRQHSHRPLDMLEASWGFSLPFSLMLSIVSTPIGNLGDITDRARKALTDCTAIVCEDTRVTGKLLELLGFPKKELLSFHSYTGRKKVHQFVERLKKGEHLVLVSDAGTPGISGPKFPGFPPPRQAPGGLPS